MVWCGHSNTRFQSNLQHITQNIYTEVYIVQKQAITLSEMKHVL